MVLSIALARSSCLVLSLLGSLPDTGALIAFGSLVHIVAVRLCGSLVTAWCSHQRRLARLRVLSELMARSRNLVLSCCVARSGVVVLSADNGSLAIDGAIEYMGSLYKSVLSPTCSLSDHGALSGGLAPSCWCSRSDWLARPKWCSQESWLARSSTDGALVQSGSFGHIVANPPFWLALSAWSSQTLWLNSIWLCALPPAIP